MELNALFHRRRRSWLNREDEKSLPSIFATFLQALSSCNRWVGAIFSIHSEMSYAIKVKPNFSHKNCKLSSRAASFRSLPCLLPAFGFALTFLLVAHKLPSPLTAHGKLRDLASESALSLFFDGLARKRKSRSLGEALIVVGLSHLLQQRDIERQDDVAADYSASISRGFILSGDTFYNF